MAVYSGYPSMSLIVVLNVDIKLLHVKISKFSKTLREGKECLITDFALLR